MGDTQVWVSADGDRSPAGPAPPNRSAFNGRSGCVPSPCKARGRLVSGACARGAPGLVAESLGRPGNATVRHIGCRGQAGRAGALHLAPPAVGEPAQVFAWQHAEFPMATAPDKGV